MFPAIWDAYDRNSPKTSSYSKDLDHLRFKLVGVDFVMEVLLLLDLFAPLITAMIKSQSVKSNVWDTVLFIKKVINRVKEMTSELEELSDSDAVLLSKENFPNSHDCISSLLNENPTYRGHKLEESWEIVEEKTESILQSGKKKRKTVIEWLSRSNKEVLDGIKNIGEFIISELEKK